MIRQTLMLASSAAALALPLSVAVTNAALGLALVLSLVSGDMKRGCLLLYRHHRPLALALLAVPALMLLSLAWSPAPSAGLAKVGHLWFFLLLPPLASLLRDARIHTSLLVSLSVGLTIHLVYCVVQASGRFHIIVASAASSPEDPAGLIGHIGFGFVYGLWAGWLLLHAFQHRGWQRWLPVMLASWAIVMIFIVQGRGGYLTALTIILLILWKEFAHGKIIRRLPWIAAVVILLSGALALGPGQERIQQTWHQIQAAASGDLKHGEARLPLWITSFRAWKQKPWAGHGTGGFVQARDAIIEQHPELNTSQMPYLAHPHNIYLLAMVREGLIGLAALLILLVVWIRSGWNLDWRHDTAGYLISAPGLALLVNGLTSSSLEEHYSGILAVLLLAAGLARHYANHQQHD